MPKINAEYCREYRKKKKGNKVKKVAKTSTERVRKFRARQKSILNKKRNNYTTQKNTSTAQNSENIHHPKLLVHHVIQHDKVFKKHITDTNIKEVCYKKGNEDIQVNINEQVYIKAENPQSPFMNEQMEYQINNEHIEIKQEVPCEYTDFDDNRSMPQQDYQQVYDMLHQEVSNEKLTNINIKQEVCNEKTNKDIQLDGNGHLQIKSEQTQSLITDETITQNKIDAEKYAKDFASENKRSKLLVPEMKVFILEISPLKYTHFDDQHSMPEQDDYTTPKITAPESIKLKKNKVKTPAECSREYRARKKARQMAAREESNNPTPNQAELLRHYQKSESNNLPRFTNSQIIPKTSAERSRNYRARKKALKEPHKEIQESENSNLKSQIIPKTSAERSREYRARKKVLKELQKEHQKSEYNNLNSQIIPKTSAVQSHECRARTEAYIDLEEPIPIEPSIELVVSNDPFPLYTYQNSILPDVDYNTDIPNAETANINDTRQESSDSRIGLHDVLHHIHNNISNKFSSEISTNTYTLKETPYAEVNEVIDVNINEQLHVKTEHIQDSISEKVESNFLASESTVNNVYGHILKLKQEVPCEYTHFEDNQSKNNIQNTDINLREGFRIKCEENQNPDSQLIGPSTEIYLPPFNQQVIQVELLSNFETRRTALLQMSRNLNKDTRNTTEKMYLREAKEEIVEKISDFPV